MRSRLFTFVAARFSARKLPAKIILLAMAATLFAALPAQAFNSTDAAGINGTDLAFGGFIDLGTTCGASCKLSYTDEQVRSYQPAAGQPNFPIHWSSGASSLGVAGDTTKPSLWVSSNGWISFIAPSGAVASNASFPNSGKPAAMIAGVWADLDPSNNTDGIYVQLQGTSPNRVWVVHFKAVNQFASFGGCKYNFEFQVFESNSHVDVYYGSNSNGVLCANGKGGEQNSLVNTGVNYFNSTTSKPQNVAVRYADTAAPGVSSVVATCGVAGTNGWCRSATNTLTATDNNDASLGQVGLGVKSRTYGVTGGITGTYTSGSATSITTGEGVLTAVASAIDWANNSGSRSATLKVDSVAPALAPGTSCSLLGGGGWCRGTLTVTPDASDATSLIASKSCTLDGNAVTCGAATDVAAGQHTLSITATDNAGNTSSQSFNLLQDPNAPSIVGSRDVGPNAHDWNNTPVTVSFTCLDGAGESGVADCTEPSTLGEGQNQSVAGSTSDIAGNSASTTVGDINIDLHAPSVAGAVTSDPNADGWYADDVGVHWTCEETLSGLDGDCPADSTITGEGDNLSAAATVDDLAGNTGAGSVGSIKIDRTAPITEAVAPPDWTPTDATVTLTATDNMSGVKSTSYRVDGGEWQNGTEIVVGDEGQHTVEFRSVDIADNSEDVHSVVVKVDKSKPHISHALTPEPNLNLWNNSDTTVTFTCFDDVSGIAACSTPTTITTDGLDQEVVGTATDLAGNTDTDTAVVNLDSQKPTISAARAPEANENGWVNQPVTVTFACADQDGLSGIASCPDAQVFGEGADQTATGTATDAADNVSDAATISGINVDLTNPTISGEIIDGTLGDNGWYTSDVTIHWTCDDGLSGIVSCPDDSTITGNGQGMSATQTVADQAGNVSDPATITVKIDRTAPEITYQGQAPAANANGWNNSDVTLTWTCSDTPSGALSPTITGLVSGETDAEGVSRSAQCQNGAGLTSATDTQGPVKIDLAKPTISGAIIAGDLGATGWYSSDVVVHWTCSDALSGVTCPADSTMTGEGPDQSVTQTVTDNAGNVSDAATVSADIDRHNPLITYLGQSPAANANGWNNSGVSLQWACSDTGAGAQQPFIVKTLNSETAGTDVSATCVDGAGNTASDTQGPIKIDLGAPSAAIDDLGLIPVKLGLTGDELTGTAGDALSGVESVAVTFVPIDPLGALISVKTITATCTGGCAAGTTTTWSVKAADVGIGAFAVTAIATDRAGNAGAPSAPVVVIVGP